MQPTHPENPWISRQHDPFDAPVAEDEADIQEPVVEDGADAGDGDAAREGRELGHSTEEDSA